jgi:cytochrome c biogenesis protein CcdA
MKLIEKMKNYMWIIEKASGFLLIGVGVYILYKAVM